MAPRVAGLIRFAGKFNAGHVVRPARGRCIFRLLWPISTALPLGGPVPDTEGLHRLRRPSLRRACAGLSPGHLPSPGCQGRGTGPDGVEEMALLRRRTFRFRLCREPARRPLGWAGALSPRVGRWASLVFGTSLRWVSGLDWPNNRTHVL